MVTVGALALQPIVMIPGTTVPAGQSHCGKRASKTEPPMGVLYPRDPVVAKLAMVVDMQAVVVGWPAQDGADGAAGEGKDGLVVELVPKLNPVEETAWVKLPDAL